MVFGTRVLHLHYLINRTQSHRFLFNIHCFLRRKKTHSVPTLQVIFALKKLIITTSCSPPFVPFSAYAFELEPADPDGHYGYVRLSRDEGQGRVCVPDLTERTADVLCREAGYVAGMTFTRPLPPSAGGPVWSGEVECGDRAVDINGCDRKVEWTFKQQAPDTCNPAAVFCFASKGRELLVFPPSLRAM